MSISEEKLLELKAEFEVIAKSKWYNLEAIQHGFKSTYTNAKTAYEWTIFVKDHEILELNSQLGNLGLDVARYQACKAIMLKQGEAFGLKFGVDMDSKKIDAEIDKFIALNAAVQVTSDDCQP